jgi:dTDP-4-dehydrorhamnose 3,5-epimerase
VQVPNLVYHGWKCISPSMSLVINVPTSRIATRARRVPARPHDTLPYDWTRKDG